MWSKTQAVIAKSSAESELYGAVKGACEALGIRTLCHDIGWNLDVRLELDAKAAEGILDGEVSLPGFGSHKSVARDDVFLLGITLVCGVNGVD